MWEVGDITGSDAYKSMVGKIKEVAEAAGWVTLRSSVGEWIGFSDGLSGTEEIYLGFKTYESVAQDYYNILSGMFVGYVAGNPFENQPGARLSGVPAHNVNLGYYLTVNKQRIAFCLKVGPPVYMHCYLGKMFPYSRPSQFPYPVVSGGMLVGAAGTRYSDTNLTFPYMGNWTTQANLFLRDPGGTYAKTYNYPFSRFNDRNLGLIGGQGNMCITPVNGNYPLEPVILQQMVDPWSVWGELDGVYAIPGFGAVSENVIQVGGDIIINQSGMTVTQAVEAILDVNGRAFVMLQNAYRNTWSDFIALEMS